jgi:hypothetical protein
LDIAVVAPVIKTLGLGQVLAGPAAELNRDRFILKIIETEIEVFE